MQFSAFSDKLSCDLTNEKIVIHKLWEPYQIDIFDDCPVNGKASSKMFVNILVGRLIEKKPLTKI